MSKTFIKLSSKNSENKGSIISQVHTALSLTYGRQKDEHCDHVLQNDLISIFKINNELVGLISHQNPSQNWSELVEKLISQTCKIILFTTVNKELTNVDFDSVLRRYNYKTINLEPFWSQAIEFDYLAQIEVENIIELVETLTDSRIDSFSKKRTQLLMRKKEIITARVAS